MKKVLLVIMIFFIGLTTAFAKEDFAPNAKSAILIDNFTGQVLFEKNADEPLPPASMTKLASMLIIMEAIDNNKLSYDDEVIISKEASNMGGSQVFLQEGETYKVKDLLKGVAIASGNDAVVALAEKVAGSQEKFVEILNKRLKEIGAKSTNFVNVHGLDAKGHVSTARDMAIIARELLKHKEILKFTSIYEDYLEKNDGSKTWLVNTNKLVRFYDGVDGLKTGYTANAKYCLTATASRNNFRLISVVMGEESSETRSSDTVKMLKYGFNTFKINVIKTKDDILGKIRVLNGKVNEVNIYLKDDATELLKNTDEVKNYTFRINIDKIKAPVKSGDIIGNVSIIDFEGDIVKEVPITIKKDLKKANLFDYIKRNISISLAGKRIIKQ